MQIYIGGPIDASLGNPLQNFEDLTRVIQDVAGDEVIIFNPCSAFKVGSKSTDREGCKYVIDINNTALDNSDLAIFVWSDSPSFGVPYEIQRRSLSGKSFIVWNRSLKPAGIYLKQMIFEAKTGVYAGLVRDRIKKIVDSEKELEKTLIDFFKSPSDGASGD